ncbi:MAG: hypothetical protein MR450_01620 [Prevotella sp.]|nr:hypothetical protein [Prevotella sp.]MDY4038516.1 hypothetical protein [Prevotella sp.]
MRKSRILSHITTIVCCLVCITFVGCGLPAVPADYQQRITNVTRPIERKYIVNGPYAVSCQQTALTDKKIKMISVWYPTAMTNSREKFPLVIMANGTGIKASAYVPIFQHLASCGFIVAGNEDEWSGDGRSTSQTLDFMLKENKRVGSVFHQHIDVDHIGVAGHSQGGVGVFSAITAWPNGRYYKAAVAMSPTHRELSIGFMHVDYDISKVGIPLLITASSAAGRLNDGGDGKGNRICGIADMREDLRLINAAHPTVPVVIGRLADKTKNHGDNMMESEPYLAAWFSYWLKNDKSAGKAFMGNSPEIRNNPRWRDVECVSNNKY